MADDDWFAEDPAETAAGEAAAAEAAAAEAAAAATAAAETAAAAEGAAAVEAEGVVMGHDPNAKLIFKHWVRPKFLQYGYMYDYRRNYYDDVIDYMDRRQRGVLREKPRAQTWAERALRTYVSRPRCLDAAQRAREDAQLLQHISTGARFHRYHSKSLISRKYSKLGINTVSI